MTKNPRPLVTHSFNSLFLCWLFLASLDIAFVSNRGKLFFGLARPVGFSSYLNSVFSRLFFLGPSVGYSANPTCGYLHVFIIIVHFGLIQLNSSKKEKKDPETDPPIQCESPKSVDPVDDLDIPVALRKGRLSSHTILFKVLLPIIVCPSHSSHLCYKCLLNSYHHEY